MEEQRADGRHRDPGDRSRSDEPAAGPTPLQRSSPLYVFYDVVWHRRRRGANVPLLVWLLVAQLVVVALLVYWVL